jgi:hypothetical protein
MPTRVLFAGVPTMLRDILEHGFASHADIEVIDEVVAGHGIENAVARTKASAVVMCSEDGTLSQSDRSVLDRFPRLKIIVLTSDGRSGSLYRLVLARMLCTDISPPGVLAAIRFRDVDVDA